MRIVQLAGAGLLGAATVLLEFSLTRLYSLVFAPSGVFLLLGLAAPGLATGALVAFRLGWRPARRPAVAAAAAAIAGSAVLLVAISATTGVLAAAAPLQGLLTYLAAAALGAALAAAVALVPGNAGAAAAAGLASAAAGAAAAPWLLRHLSPPDVALLAAALVGLAAPLFAAALLARTGAGRGEARPEPLDDDGPGAGALMRGLGAAVAGAAALCAVAAFPANLALDWIRTDPASVPAVKSLFASVGDQRQPETVVFSRWDEASRIDVTESARAPEVRWLYHDGAFGGLVYRRDRAGATAADIGNVPFAIPGAREKVLIIGAGGGDEVQLALAAGARDVVVAEPSAAVTAALRSLGTYSGDALGQPGVRVVAQDGRGFLRSSGEQFDLIYLTFGASDAALPGGVLANEHLYTIEAFGEYMDALRQDGHFAVRLRDEPELIRAFNTAFQAWTRRGAAPIEALRRLVALSDQQMAQRGAETAQIVLPILTVRKAPYSEDDASRLVESLRGLPHAPLFIPHLESRSMLSGFAVEEIGPAAIEAQAPYDIRPASDGNPFFFEPGKGLPWLLMLAPVALLLVTGAVGLATRRPQWDGLDGDLPDEAVRFFEDDLPWRHLAFVAAAGAGVGLLLLPLLHRTPLLLGQPALAAPLVYGAVYGGGAIGALAVAFARPAALRPLAGWAALAAALYGAALLELLPLVDNGLRGHGFGVRLASLAVLLAPLGAGLAIPLPAAVLALARAGRGAWAPLLFAVAALAFTLGQFVAFVAGVASTFTLATVLGAAAMFGAFMMVGLRALPLGVEVAAAPAAEPADLSRFQPPPPPPTE